MSNRHARWLYAGLLLALVSPLAHLDQAAFLRGGYWLVVLLAAGAYLAGRKAPYHSYPREQMIRGAERMISFALANLQEQAPALVEVIRLDPPGLLDEVEPLYRKDIHQVLSEFNDKDWEEAITTVRQDPGLPETVWDAERFEQTLEPFFTEYGELLFTPEARRHQWTQIRSTGDRTWDVTHTLLDPEGDNLWAIIGSIDLRDPDMIDGPLVRLHRLGTGARKAAQMLKMGPNTERAYREALSAAGLALVPGCVQALIALDARVWLLAGLAALAGPFLSRLALLPVVAGKAATANRQTERAPPFRNSCDSAHRKKDSAARAASPACVTVTPFGVPVACAGVSSNDPDPNPSTPTPPGTYNLEVKGVSGSTEGVIDLNVIVQ